MNKTLRQLTVVGFLFLACIAAQHRPADGTQQASFLPVFDTIGTDLNAKQAGQFIEATPGLVVLDVRTPEEYTMGHIREATNINFYGAKFVNQLVTLDRSKTYVVHCAAGLANGRSRKTVALMDSLGFKNIRHLNGGFTSWQQAGQPIIKP